MSARDDERNELNAATSVDDPEHGPPVGYKRPPRQHQFKPGQSGNPKGRAKGAKGLRTELREEMDQMVTVAVDGKPTKIRTRRLIIKSLVAQAAKGSVNAADKLIALLIRVEGLEDERPAAKALSETDQLILKRLLSNAPEEECSAEIARDEARSDDA